MPNTNVIWGLATIAMLAVQAFVSLTLGGAGLPALNSDAMNMNGYLFDFKPHQVVVVMGLAFGLAQLLGSLGVRVISPLAVFKFSIVPLTILVAYLAVLTVFIVTDRIYQDPNFRSDLVFIDPFKVFAIPFWLRQLFVVLPVMLLAMVRKSFRT